MFHKIFFVLRFDKEKWESLARKHDDEKTMNREQLDVVYKVEKVGTMIVQIKKCKLDININKGVKCPAL